MGQATPSPHPSGVILNPGKVGRHGGSCGEELSTLVKGGTARSDYPPSQHKSQAFEFRNHADAHFEAYTSRNETG